MNQVQRNKATIRALFEAADRGDLEAVAGFYSPDYVDHDATEARSDGTTPFEATVRAFRIFLEGFPDTRHTLHDLIAEGDRVVVRLSAEATHTGEAFGQPPTGLRVRNDSIAIYRLAEGKIVERWARENRGVLDQIRAARAESPGKGAR